MASGVSNIPVVIGLKPKGSKASQDTHTRCLLGPISTPDGAILASQALEHDQGVPATHAPCRPPRKKELGGRTRLKHSSARRFPVPSSAFQAPNEYLLHHNPDLLRGERLLLFLLQHALSDIFRVWPDRSMTALSHMKRRALQERATRDGMTYNEAYRMFDKDRKQVRANVKAGAKWVLAIQKVVLEGQGWQIVQDVLGRDGDDLNKAIDQDHRSRDDTGATTMFEVEQRIVEEIAPWNHLQSRVDRGLP